MGKHFEVIAPEQRKWIENQKVFFVSTAPLDQQGHINCSPKGLDSLRILSENKVVYQDLTGSGVETIAHLQENGRMVIMFCAFEGPPKIMRLHGIGEVVLPADAEFSNYQELFPSRIGVRSYIVLHVHRVSDSCGYGVPLMDFKSDRDVMIKWADHKGEAGVAAYQQQKNLNSIDGLPALKRAEGHK